ncbi:flagellar basal body-associated FliL family protein [Marinobacterium sp. D7]|uniref:flagellar basal body-associated FliL family protein n=1 Tax=Marinobacterium ramblicola TaxID=2849041 RepID=UPI001C2DAA03|nr:flagellar basal body-associated FliL family protein [Marinobacterium ramblicola]MBV1789342.1 flagellar basal body-associated FliL family protein [Marinobacterium ramblicola]
MAEDAQSQVEGESGKGSRKKLIIIIAIAALLLLGGGGAAAFFLLSGGEDATVEAVEPVRKEALYTKVRTLEGRPMFVVTLQSDDGQRHYMQAYVEAKSRDQEVVDALELHMPLVVARLNTLFSTQKFETLMTIEGKRALRQQAVETVQSIMQDKIGRPGVESILFTNLVMQ